MRYAWLIVAVFAGRFFAKAIFAPPGDGDLAWQRWLGQRIVTSGALPHTLGTETFTAAGAAWVPQEWLFSVCAYLSRGADWPIFAGACALAATAALVVVAFAAARRGAHPIAVALCTACCAIALIDSFGVRVQVVAWALFALFLFLLEIDGPLAYLAIGVVALWSNVHASVELAPALATVAFGGSLLDRGWCAATRRIGAIAIGAALATCANPLGIRLPLYAVSLLRSPFKTYITEWKHTDIGDPSFAFGALPLACAIVLFGLYGTSRWRDRLLFVALGWLMFSAARNIAIFALASAPFAASALSNGIAWLRERSRADARPGRSVRWAEPAFAVLLAIGVMVASMQAIANDRSDDEWPKGGLAAIAALPGRPHVFCADFSWCGPLLSSPRASVFLDGRADPYPQSVWDDFGRIVRVQSDWQQRLAKRHVDVILVARASTLEGGLALASGWHPIYSDRRYRVWQRTDAAATEAADRAIGKIAIH